jgi:hypothetical protein
MRLSVTSLNSVEEFEAFGEFINHFEQLAAKRLYRELVIVRMVLEVSSRHDPLASSRRELVFAALPFLADSKVCSNQASQSSLNR